MLFYTKVAFKETYLTAEESGRWMRYHESAYKEDRDMAGEVSSPRWAVIMAYYAMHNISKLYLAKVHNLRVAGSEVHAQTIHFMAKYATSDEKRLLPLLKKAKEEYEAITSASVWIMPRLLAKGRDERAKTQYYESAMAQKSRQELMRRAQYFIANFMKPYLEILEGLL